MKWRVELKDDLDPEEFWAGLLSEAPGLILAAWRTLTVEEQVAVRAHLLRMSGEEGWAAAQRRAAHAALKAIRDGKG